MVAIYKHSHLSLKNYNSTFILLWIITTSIIFMQKDYYPLDVPMGVTTCTHPNVLYKISIILTHHLNFLKTCKIISLKINSKKSLINFFFNIMFLSLCKSHLGIYLAFIYHIHAYNTLALSYSFSSTTWYFKLLLSFNLSSDSSINGYSSTMNVSISSLMHDHVLLVNKCTLT